VSKRKKDPDEKAEPAPPTESEVRATVPGRNPHTGEPQGMLVPNRPGSNGGVHRGPDLVPFRRNVVRAVILHELAKAGLNLEDLKKKTKKRGPLLPGAMVEYCGAAYRRIAIKAALGDPRAFGPFVSMMDHIHRVMQPAKDEIGNGGQAPRRAVFIGPNEPVPPPGAEPTTDPGAPGTVVDKDGQTWEDPGA